MPKLIGQGLWLDTVGKGEDEFREAGLRQAHVRAGQSQERGHGNERRPLVAIEKALALRNVVGEDRRLTGEVDSLIGGVVSRTGQSTL